MIHLRAEGSVFRQGLNITYGAHVWYKFHIAFEWLNVSLAPYIGTVSTIRFRSWIFPFVYTRQTKWDIVENSLLQRGLVAVTREQYEGMQEVNNDQSNS